MTPAPLVILDEIDSTNAEARRLAEAGEAGPRWIVARRQTAGRGRRGRKWETEQGNLAATLLITTPKSAAEAAQATFVAALAVADLLDVFVSPALVSIKWPNDVLLDGVKVSGILVESGAHANGDLWLAVGIGVNLAHAPDDTERGATSIAERLRADLAFAPPHRGRRRDPGRDLRRLVGPLADPGLRACAGRLDQPPDRAERPVRRPPGQ